MNKALRRKVYLAIRQLRGKSTTRFAPHGVDISIPPGVDDNIRYQLSRGRAYEVPEGKFVKDVLTQGQQVIELGGSLGVVSALIRSVIGPDAMHVIVEANEALLTVCGDNAGRSDATKVVHAAIDYSGANTVSFDTGSGAHVGTVSTDQTGGMRVPTVQLGSVTKMLPKPRFALVCDIEGMEAALFEHEGALLADMDAIIVETHPHAYADGMLTVESMKKSFEAAGLVQRGAEDDVLCYVRPA